MARFQTFISLDLDRDSVHAICIGAISALNWRMTGESDTRITCQELAEPDCLMGRQCYHASSESLAASLKNDVALTINPTRLVICFETRGGRSTALVLNGASIGSSSLQFEHVRRCVMLLAEAIECGAQLVNEHGRDQPIPIDRGTAINRQRTIDAVAPWTRQG
ncbi:MAG: hypothetical protein IPK66_01570 [Rhodospirillales bacterium]|nr:hypothetical protein [Rhodospirillales bacterium]